MSLQQSFVVREGRNEHPLKHRSRQAHEAVAPRFSVIVPCYNEEAAIAQTVAQLHETLRDCGPFELIIVDDGSTDGTSEKLADLVNQYPSLLVLTHVENRGYGASLKTAVQRASAELIVITDADGTYPNDRIPELVAYAEEADMVVGSRTGVNVTYPLLRRIPKVFLKAHASWIAGRRIPDINSGLRVFRRSAALRFLGVLPNGFSFTTTITLALLTNGYSVKYVPISYAPRVGKSKIRPIYDTTNFVRLIVCTGMYFAPLRVLLPVLAFLTVLFAGCAGYDAFVLENFSEKTLILLMLCTNTALFALLSDMIVKKTSEMQTDTTRRPDVVCGPLVKVAGRLHREATDRPSDEATKRAA